jgi:hypothetical protein
MKETEDMSAGPRGVEALLGGKGIMGGDDDGRLYIMPFQSQVLLNIQAGPACRSCSV